MSAKKMTLSPSKLRSCHNLAAQAMARVQGQDVLFKGMVRYDFPKDRPIKEEELLALRSYIAERTKLSIEYSVGLEGVMHPQQLELELGQIVSISNFESVSTYTMQVWQYGKDEGKVGMYFRPCGDGSRLEKMRFRAVEFTPDHSGNISPARDEELRHKLCAALTGYINKENINSTTFPTLSTKPTLTEVSA